MDDAPPPCSDLLLCSSLMLVCMHVALPLQGVLGGNNLSRAQSEAGLTITRALNDWWRRNKQKDIHLMAANVTNALVSYLRSQGATNISDCGLEIGISDSGFRGVFATRPFKPGDCMCTSNSCIVVHCSSASRHRCSDRCSTGCYLYRSYPWGSQGTQIVYKPYLDTLPTRDYCFSPTPDFLSDEEIWLLPWSIVQRVMERKNSKLSLHPSMLEGIDFETLQFVTWLVTSRKFTITQRNQQRTVLLIPFFDFLNHSSDDCPNAKLKVAEQKDGEEDSFYMLESIRCIAVNDHVTIAYGSDRHWDIRRAVCQVRIRTGVIQTDRESNQWGVNPCVLLPFSIHAYLECLLSVYFVAIVWHPTVLVGSYSLLFVILIMARRLTRTEFTIPRNCVMDWHCVYFWSCCTSCRSIGHMKVPSNEPKGCRTKPVEVTLV
jgi:hypothetical protein